MVENPTFSKKILNFENLSPAVKNVQYAVRGKISIRAGEIEKELKQVKYLTIIIYSKKVHLLT